MSIDFVNPMLERRDAKRNASIELFRIVLMVLICVRHAFSMTGYGHAWEVKLFSWCVPGFAFISGYYGVRFSWSKLMRLWVLAAVLILLPAAGYCFWNQNTTFWRIYRHYLLSNWYLNAYTVLLLLSPLINGGLIELRRVGPRAFLPIFALCFLSWALEAYGIRDFMPKIAGMGAMSFFSVFYAYVTAFFFREFDIPRLLTPKRLLVFLLASAASLPLVGSYTFPLSILLAGIVFVWFSKLNVCVCGGGVTFASASVFPIYLLHTNSFCFERMKEFIENLMSVSEMPRVVILVICGLAMFVACLCVDLVRRLFLLAVHRIWCMNRT